MRNQREELIGHFMETLQRVEFEPSYVQYIVFFAQGVLTTCSVSNQLWFYIID